MHKWLWIVTIALLGLAVGAASPVLAGNTTPNTTESAEESKTIKDLQKQISDLVAKTETNEGSVTTLHTETNWLWTCLAAFLVFFMQAGFSLVEAGFTRAKNAVNILMKNLMDLSCGSIVYWIVGFGLMFGAVSETTQYQGWFGTDFFFVSGTEVQDSGTITGGSIVEVEVEDDDGNKEKVKKIQVTYKFEDEKTEEDKLSDGVTIHIKGLKGSGSFENANGNFTVASLDTEAKTFIVDGVEDVKSEGSSYVSGGAWETIAFDHNTATFWMFQVVFAATAATIVSGAVAERTNFIGYLIYSVLITAFVYPIFGSWAWGSLFQGQGWLEAGDGSWLARSGLPGFQDYAGSTVVHSVGGWAALMGAMILGPRRGKYIDGKVHAIPGHSMPMAALGVFILWLGWFGFNAGSTTAVDGGEFARLAVTTNLSAAAGAISAMITSWLLTAAKKPQIDMALNGALAGLVGITAPCATVTFAGAIIIGLVAGVIVYLAVKFFDMIRIDDPVGAISVHGVCGVWGTLAIGLFNAESVLGTGTSSSGLFYGGGVSQLTTQAIGCLACFAWVVVTCGIIFGVLRIVGLLRVTEEEETRGLDIFEHGTRAYHMTDMVT